MQRRRRAASYLYPSTAKLKNKGVLSRQGGQIGLVQLKLLFEILYKDRMRGSMAFCFLGAKILYRPGLEIEIPELVCTAN